MVRLLEHSSLDLLAEANITVPPHEVAASADAAAEATRRLGGPVVVKALVPRGGRAKAGAVIRADDPRAAAEAARRLLGESVGAFPVRQVLVQARVSVAHECFAAITFDSMTRSPLVLLSTAGGVDAEAAVESEAERLVARAIDPAWELPSNPAAEIATSAGLAGRFCSSVAETLRRLYRVFVDHDAFLVEVNPLALAPDGGAVILSAVVVLDDQATFRHPEWERLADDAGSNGLRPLTPLERQMREIDAIDSGSAIRFSEFPEGRIACMLTGDGCGLVAFDHFQRLGETPATMFDITPGRVEEKMYLATKAILGRPGLAGLIAGGNITNFIPVDVKVRGVVRALRELGVDGRRFPVMFRYAGPGVDVARTLAAEIPGLEFHDETTSIEGAVDRIVQRVRTAAS
jgi:succinyl-CoA synthetase beta subunit